MLRRSGKVPNPMTIDIILAAEIVEISKTSARLILGAALTSLAQKLALFKNDTIIPENAIQLVNRASVRLESLR